MKKTLPLIGFAFVLIGCTSVVPIGSYPQVALDQTDDKMNQDKTRVILTKTKNNTGSRSVSGIEKKADGKLRTILHKGGINIVDVNRSIRNRLEKEFALIEAGGTSAYTPSKAANIAISSEVNTVFMETDPVPATSYTVDGKKYYTKAHCKYTAKVEGSVILYGVNPVSKEHSFTFSGGKTFNDEGANGGRCPNLQKGQKQSLFTQALTSAMESVENKIKNSLASRGYVVTARKNDKDGAHYYRLSIKPSDGAKPGVEVQFLDSQKIDGKKEYFPFAKGKIVCTDMPQNSYAKISSPEAIPRIKKGTPVKLQFSDSLLNLLELPQNLTKC